MDSAVRDLLWFVMGWAGSMDPACPDVYRDQSVGCPISGLQAAIQCFSFRTPKSKI